MSIIKYHNSEFYIPPITFNKQLRAAVFVPRLTKVQEIRLRYLTRKMLGKHTIKAFLIAAIRNTYKKPVQ